MGQRGKGHHAAFAVIVGAQDDHHIFERDDQHERPEDEADNPEDM